MHEVIRLKPKSLKIIVPIVIVLTALLVVMVGSIGATSTLDSHRFHSTPDPEATPQVGAEASRISDPTYFRDVEPIFQQNCAACHTEGGIGYATFDLNNLDLISDPVSAAYIADLVGIGYMPPWPPGENSLPMQHERTLTQDEIALIARWAANGAPMGDPETRQTAPPATNIPQLEPDRVLTMSEPYTPSGELLDDYRCFLVDPEFNEDRLVTGMDFQPSNTEIAHHALFFIADEAMIEEAQRLEGQDGRPGWSCFGGPGLATAQRNRNLDPQALTAALDAQGVSLVTLTQALNAHREAHPRASLDMPALQEILSELGVDVQQLIADIGIDVADVTASGMVNSIGGWVPGSVPVVSPENTGIHVPAGSQIIIQMHYNLYYSMGSDQSTLLLETEPFNEDMTALSTPSLLAPVEIPCPEGAEGADCQRPNRGARTSNALLAVCDQTLDTYANNTAENAYGYCDYPISYEGWIIGLGPHMHELGKATRIVLNPDTPEATTLIDIPDWDFHWQGQYSLVQPVELKPGDTLRVECWWDNSEGDRYVVWGEGTQDEMCFHFTRILVREPGKTLADYGFDMPGAMHGHAHHHHEQVEVSDDMAIPSVDLSVTQTDAGGYYVQLAVQNFDFAPEAVDSAHVPGQGHAHLYVNGEQVARLYSTEHYLETVPAGEVELRVTLNANDHRIYAHHGDIIEARVTLSGP